MKYLAAIALLASACGSTGVSSRAQSAGAATQESGGVGAVAPDFTLRDTEGRQVSLSDYLGKKVILIDFWATWCIPCQAELPHLEEMYKKYKDQGLVVLGIAMDGPETIAQVPSYVSRYNLTFPVLLDTETQAVALYNPKRSAPLGVEIDRTGKIARVRSGYSSGDEKLVEADIVNLLK